MPELHAVVEGSFLDQAETWVPLPSVRPPLLRLSRHTAPPNIALVVAQLCSYNSEVHGPHHPSILASLLQDDEIALPGGLASVNGALIIPPACCCGLEDWREWLDLLGEGRQPWLGHSPAPWVEANDGLFTVWSDGGLGDPPLEPPFSITFTRDELHRAVHQAEDDMTAFLQPLGEWIASNTEVDPGAFRSWFARAFALISS